MIDITGSVLSDFDLGDLLQAERLVNQSTQSFRIGNFYTSGDFTLSYTIAEGESSGSKDILDSTYTKAYYGRKNRFDTIFDNSNGIVCPPGFNLILFDTTMIPNNAAFTAGLSTIRFLLQTQLIESDGSLGTAEYARGFFKHQSIFTSERTPYSAIMGFHSESYRLVTPQLNAVLSAAVAADSSFNIPLRRPQLIAFNFAPESQSV